jgi:hypothetical protein
MGKPNSIVRARRVVQLNRRNLRADLMENSLVVWDIILL